VVMILCHIWHCWLRVCWTCSVYRQPTPRVVKWWRSSTVQLIPWRSYSATNGF